MGLGAIVGAALGAVGAAAHRIAVDDPVVIEAVARAVAEEDDEAWDELTKKQRGRYTRLARAAVASLAAQMGQGVRVAVTEVASMHGGVRGVSREP